MCEPIYKAGTGYEVRRIQFHPSGVSEKDAISMLVYVCFPLTLWVKKSLSNTPSECFPAHPICHQVNRYGGFYEDLEKSPKDC